MKKVKQVALRQCDRRGSTGWKSEKWESFGQKNTVSQVEDNRWTTQLAA